MERTNLKDYALSVLKGSKLCNPDWVKAVNLVKDRYEREDMIGRFLESIFRDIDCFAVYGDSLGIDYRIFIFTGKIFEPIDRGVLWSALDELLYSLDIKAIDRGNKKVWGYVARVYNIIRDRVLSPNLSVMSFRNCVVDFRDLKVYKHSPKFDCLKLYDFDYDEHAECPLWQTFLGSESFEGAEVEGVLPEAHKRRVLQSFLGASLLDRKGISFEYFLILQGTGANGKSVIYRVLKDIFGDEEILNIRLSQFSRLGDEQLRAAHSMRGKRMMYCTESSKGDFKDLSILKAISSGEPIASRQIGGNIEMLQVPPIMLCNSNYKWTVKDFLNKNDPNDESVSRRALIINFDKTISVENRDTMLSQRLYNERAGIFQWLVRGLKRLKRDKYRISETLDGKMETALAQLHAITYSSAGKKISGSVSEYIKYKKCQADFSDGWEAVNVPVSGFYENYMQFCELHNVPEVSIKKFSLDLGELGYEKFKDHTRNYSMSAKVYVHPDDKTHFLVNVPMIAEELTLNIFEGEETVFRD